MNQVTAKGQTVDEAVQSALAQLDTTKERVEISIVDEGKKGFLGLFGARPAIVNVIVKPDAIESAKQFLQTVIRNMGIKVILDVIQEDERSIRIDITGEKMGLLIGKRGQTINSLQYLTQLAANRQSDHYVNVLLNPEGYRDRRKETLTRLAKRLASKATHIGWPVSLEPMPNYERKIIHTALSEDEQVVTLSEGEEPNRYVIIKPNTSRS